MSLAGVISIVAGVSLTAAGLGGALPETPAIRLPTRTMLAKVARFALPTCPIGSTAKGFIIARVETRADGTVQTVSIEPSWDRNLENSPEAKSIQYLLKNWSFKPETLRGVPVMVRSRIFFYVDCHSPHPMIAVPGLTDTRKEAR